MGRNSSRTVKNIRRLYVSDFNSVTSVWFLPGCKEASSLAWFVGKGGIFHSLVCLSPEVVDSIGFCCCCCFGFFFFLLMRQNRV